MTAKLSSDVGAAATVDAVHAHAMCEDLAAVLFPKAGHLPSEAVQAAVGAKLHDLVFSIEQALIGSKNMSQPFSEAWQLLAGQGQLRLPSLIEFALARVSEDRIVDRLETHAKGAALNFLPSRLLKNDNTLLAEMAKALLVAEMHRRDPRKYLYLQMDPALLQQAATLVSEAMPAERWGDQDAKTALANFLNLEMEPRRLPYAAEKLIFALDAAFQGELIDPLLSGTHLYVAALSRETGLPHDTIIRMIDAQTAAPLILLLTQRKLSPAQMASQIEILRGISDDDPVFDTIYDNASPISPETANQLLALWRRRNWGGDAA